MKFRSTIILSIVVLFSTSDSLFAQLFKKAKAARKKAVAEENARLDVNASFYELLQNKQYPVSTSLSDAFKSNYSVTELTPYEKKKEKVSTRLFKMNVKGAKKSGGLGAQLIGGAIAKKTNLSLDLHEKMEYARDQRYRTGYVVPHRKIVGNYNIIGPIFKDFSAPDEEFNLESHNDGNSYMRGDEGTRYWNIDRSPVSKELIVKSSVWKGMKDLDNLRDSNHQWLDGDDLFYADMFPNGKIRLMNVKTRRGWKIGRDQIPKSKRELSVYKENLEKGKRSVGSYIKSTIQEFGYSVQSSDDPDDKYNCFCKATYGVNGLDKIVESVKNSDLYSGLSELPKGFPKDQLPLFKDHLVVWNVKKILGTKTYSDYNTKLECSFSVKGDSYILNLSDVAHYPLYNGTVTRNGEILYSIKQSLDSEWGGDNYYTPTRSFTVSKNGQDIFAVTSAIEFKPPEQTKISGKSALGGMFKTMKAATKAGLAGEDAGAAMNDSNPWAETKKIKKSLLVNNNVSDSDRLPVYILGTALSHFKPVYGHQINLVNIKAEYSLLGKVMSEARIGEKTREYRGSDRYNPYAVEYITWNTDGAEGSSGGYERNIMTKYRFNYDMGKEERRSFQYGPVVTDNNGDQLQSKINPEYLYWLKHLPEGVDPIGKGKSVFDCKNCYGDRIFY
jgi:hypothetical protein